VKKCDAPVGWKCSAAAAGGGGSTVDFSGTKVESFTFEVDSPAKTGDHTFNLAQTYADGKVVRWDGPETSDPRRRS
jgi:hypothetical protein